MFAYTLPFIKAPQALSFIPIASINISDCRQALGMENGIISDAQIRASSIWDDNHAASQARLNFKGGSKVGSWSAKTNDVQQWLQVDLGSQYAKVTRVGTQGRDDASQWVTKFKLQYGNDEARLQFYKERGTNIDKVKKSHGLK